MEISYAGAARRRRSPDTTPSDDDPKRPCTALDMRAARSPSPTVEAEQVDDQPAGSEDIAQPTDPAASQRRVRFPPLIVEKLPNWAFHFRELKKKLGRAPNARPHGQGVRFSPTEENEFRTIQRYLTALRETENVEWFSYSLPAEKNMKVCIRGLPADTDVEEISEELRALGFQPEHVRPIKARQGRYGCIFFALIKRTPAAMPGIYSVTEMLNMPGIKIEAWRGRKNAPAQCHRCQKFRHSSHHCHRAMTCVRCGEGHPARQCPRPIEEPATCANCHGAHPANSHKCPVLRREARNRRGGTVARTSASVWLLVGSCWASPCEEVPLLHN